MKGEETLGMESLTSLSSLLQERKESLEDTVTE